MFAKYAWVITCDYLSMMNKDDSSNVGLVGPSNGFINKPDQIIAHPTAKRFRMKDDDGTVYVEGFICGDYDGFEPKDDFGEGGLGCTTIEYLDTEKWEEL